MFHTVNMDDYDSDGILSQALDIFEEKEAYKICITPSTALQYKVICLLVQGKDWAVIMEDQHLFTDSHAKTILSTMNNLRKMNKLCDVYLRVEGREFPAHRIVLAACSDYFCAMFTGNLSEKDQAVVELHEISADVMEELLDFVYTETVNVSVENVQELLPAACLLQLNGVKSACCSFLEKQLDQTNCLGIKIFAEQHCCDVLQAAAESYSLHHFEEVVDNEEFKSLPAQEVEQLISSNELQVNSEEPVFEAVITWVKQEPETRKASLSTLMRHIRLPLLSARYITDVVDNELLVKRDHECRDLLDEAKKFHLRPDLRTTMRGPRMKPRSGTDDVLVVVGGFGAHQNMVEVVEQYDPKTDEWISLPNLTKRRRYVASAAINGKVYVVGGYDGQARLNAVECLNLSSEEPEWLSISPMSQRRGLAGVTVYKGQLYVCGGFDGYTRHRCMEVYNPHLDTWTTLQNMATGREGAGLVVAGNMMYCIGGYDGVNLLATAEKYDIKLDEWSQISCMSTKRSGAGIAVVSENIYVCGGYDGSEHLSSVESYNIHTGHWTSLQRMTSPRCYVGACVLKGQLLVVAGYDGNTLLDTVESYDPITDEWSVLETSMSTQRCDAGVAVVRKSWPARHGKPDSSKAIKGR